ncbi:chitodextrinase [Streptacidiphilus sp. MAP12-33]|uniref:fibronectin type III domain-containing protein n=1 Tax=Streptacidiphilus sp. MAP12-33 TaxID=3156266 RepID=UPI00351729FB
MARLRLTLRWILVVALALLGLAVVPAQAQAAPGYVQGTAFTTSSRVASLSVSLTGAVGASHLLVGWFAEYNAAGQVQVSDNVNGAWTRAPGSTAFQNDTGDIALYYVQNAKASTGLTVTMRASAPAYFQGSIAEYAGVAIAGPLDQVLSSRGVGTAVDTGATASVPSGELVYSALITGGNPASVTPGTSGGLTYTARNHTASGSAFEEDIASGSAGAQHGTATLASSTDWYAVVATFRPTSGLDILPPTVPQNLHTTSVAAGSVSLAWSASTDNVAVTGYTVYRNGAVLATTGATTTTYTDPTVAANTAYSYTVDAFDGAGNHSLQSTPVQLTTPAASPAFVQGAANSPGSRTTTATLTLTSPVTAGHLLVGWFAQYDSPGQVQVSDNVNGAWTRGPASEHFTNGGGDIALYYVQNAKAAPSLTVTLSASAATYLPGAVAEYSDVAATAALDQMAVGEANSTTVDSGPTASVPGGELVVAGLITGGQPLTVTPGSSQGVPYTMQVFNGSRSTDIAGILSSAPGAQNARFTLANGSDWYAVAAAFHPDPPSAPGAGHGNGAGKGRGTGHGKGAAPTRGRR